MRSLALIAVLAGCAKTASPDGPTVPPGLAATPPRLPYLCVTPGCEELQTVQIDVRGSRRVAIKRILLAGGGAADFSFVPAEAPPFIVGGGSSFSVDVTYRPTGAPAPGEAKLLVTYTDASPDESPDRLEPGELAVPLVRRIVGEPVLAVSPKSLQFGVVPTGTTKSLPVHVSNQGFGNLVLQLAYADAGHPAFQAPLPQSTAMVPDAGFMLPITFAPTAEGYVKSEVVLTATMHEVPPAVISVEGTSLAYPRLTLQPAGDVDFGLLAKGRQRLIERQIVNQGGADLVLSAVGVTDPANVVKVQMPGLTMPLTLRPLEKVGLTLLIDGVTAGDVDAAVTLVSNDPINPMVPLRVTGTITDPRLQLTPTAIEFGNPLPDGGTSPVPQGWVLTRPLELKNVGFGPLTVKNISMVGGSSNTFSLRTLPTLPVTLERDARIAIDVEFRAESVASWNGSVSVESDDGVMAFREAPVHATVGQCGPMTCPIANGTPACGTSGVCGIASCNAGFYDTDGQASTGCECQEPPMSTDPGEFCMSNRYLGNIKDDGPGTQYTGVIPSSGDIDLVSFHGEDVTQFLSDDFDVKIRLDSADPGIRMCVYRHGGAHQSDCFFSEETCPSNRFYRDDGSIVSGDDADYVIKIFRDPQSAPTCSPYTLFVTAR
jgi:hypothetical protein